MMRCRGPRHVIHQRVLKFRYILNLTISHYLYVRFVYYCLLL